jgi:hypothetical protein
MWIPSKAALGGGRELGRSRFTEDESTSGAEGDDRRGVDECRWTAMINRRIVPRGHICQRIKLDFRVRMEVREAHPW